MEEIREWCPGAESNHRHEDFQSTSGCLFSRGEVRFVLFMLGRSDAAMKCSVSDSIAIMTFFMIIIIFILHF